MRPNHTHLRHAKCAAGESKVRTQNHHHDHGKNAENPPQEPKAMRMSPPAAHRHWRLMVAWQRTLQATDGWCTRLSQGTGPTRGGCMMCRRFRPGGIQSIPPLNIALPCCRLHFTMPRHYPLVSVSIN